MKRILLFFLLASFFSTLCALEAPIEDPNPPARPTIKGDNSLFLRGEFLYWIAQQDDLYYVADACICPQDEQVFLQSYEGCLKELDFQWDPGFRIGVGYNLPYDGWDLSLNWTHFRTDAKDCCCACPLAVDFQLEDCNKTACNLCKCCPCKCCASRLVPTFAPLCYTDNIYLGKSAFANWDLRFDAIDLELGREYYLSKRLTMRPHIGVRGVIIDQNLNTNYLNIRQVLNGMIQTTETNCADVSMKNDFWGVGPSLGFNTNWLFPCGLGFYGNLNIALLYGEFEIESDASYDRKEIIECDQCITLDCARSRLQDCFCDSKAATDLQLGLFWQGTFSRDRIALRLHIGWDHHLYFNQNQLIQFKDQFTQVVIGDGTLSQISVTQRRNGDLSLQGLVVGAQLEF